MAPCLFVRTCERERAACHPLARPVAMVVSSHRLVHVQVFSDPRMNTLEAAIAFASSSQLQVRGIGQHSSMAMPPQKLPANFGDGGWCFIRSVIVA